MLCAWIFATGVGASSDAELILRDMSRNANSIELPIVPRESGCRIPLSGTQLRIWRFKKRDGSWLSQRNCTSGVRISGPLDASALAASLSLVAQRHESLRTRFASLDESPHQVVDESWSGQLDLVDLTTMPSHEAEAEARRLTEDLAKEKVHLAVGPLFSARLYRLPSSDHVLVCALDHMIADGASLSVLDSEIWTLYRQIVSGSPPSLPKLAIQFADYALWQRRTYETRLERQEAYWRSRLENAPRVRLPGSTGILSDTKSQGSLLHLSLGPELSESLQSLARREHSMLPLVLLTVYVAVMSRWCAQDDLVVMLISNARYRRELHGMIGYLASCMYLRIQVHDREDYRGLLRRVTREFYSALIHEDLDQIPDYLPEWEYGATDAYFNWLPAYPWRRPFDCGLPDGTRIDIDSFPTRVPSSAPLLPIFSEARGEITMIVSHLPHVFSKQAVERFAENIRLFAGEFARDPLTRLRQYS